jgi:hypothetical protein
VIENREVRLREVDFHRKDLTQEETTVLRDILRDMENNLTVNETAARKVELNATNSWTGHVRSFEKGIRDGRRVVPEST